MIELLKEIYNELDRNIPCHINQIPNYPVLYLNVDELCLVVQYGSTNYCWVYIELDKIRIQNCSKNGNPFFCDDPTILQLADPNVFDKARDEIMRRAGGFQHILV